jgi:hypothetical protein
MLCFLKLHPFLYFRLVFPVQIQKLQTQTMAAFRNMSTINIGIFTDIYDFNLTTHCLAHFLDREYKNRCSTLYQSWLLFQVC